MSSREPRSNGGGTPGDGKEPTQSPLTGLRVVELGTTVAAPVCARLLADYGADVVKIEDPEHGDVGRRWGRNKFQGHSLWWPAQARNKRCVTLNLRTDRGQALARELLCGADVLVENFRPGTLERWGMAPSTLRESNPRLVVARLSAFGQTGPLRDRPGYGSIGEAVGGIRYTTGYPGEPPPRVGISIGDQAAALFGVIGIMLALRVREATGVGQIVDVAIYESILALMESTVTEYAKLGVLPERAGGRLPGVTPSNIYPTSDGEWVLIAANHDRMFVALMQAIGRPDVGRDPRFATHLQRAGHEDELDQVIASWSQGRSIEQALAILSEADVPSCKIYSPADMIADPHFWERGMHVPVQDPVLGELIVQGIVPKLSLTPGDVRWPGPQLGAHNREVFVDELGLTEEDLSDLEQRGIV